MSLHHAVDGDGERPFDEHGHAIDETCNQRQIVLLNRRQLASLDLQS